MPTRRQVLSGFAGTALLSACDEGSRLFTRRAETDRNTTGGEVTGEPHGNPHIALSLGSLQDRLAEAHRANGTIPRALSELCGINRFHGFVTSDPNDVVLLASRNADSPGVTCDDLVVALRNAYSAGPEYEGHPGCTIDPMHERKDPWIVQRVKVFGMPGGQNAPPMAARHVAVDYELKRVSAGFATLGPEVVGPYEATRAARQGCVGGDDQPRETRTTHRFWFAPLYPKSKPRFVADDQGVVIAHPTNVQVITEEEFFSRGKRTGSAEPQPAAAAFAASVTKLLNSDEVEVYSQVLNDYRIIELSRVMKFKQVPPALLAFLLEDCPLRKVAVPNFVGGIRRDEWGEAVCDATVEETRNGASISVQVSENAQRYHQQYRGGVDGNVELPEAAFGRQAGLRVSRLAAAVLDSRPSATSLAWDIRHGTSVGCS